MNISPTNVIRPIVNVVDGTNKIAETALACIDIVDFILPELPNLELANSTIHSIADWTTPVSLAKRVLDWNKVAQGVKAGERQDPLFISCLSALTISNILSFLSLLDKLDFLKLGRALNPIKKASDIFNIAASALDIGVEAKNLIHCQTDSERAVKKEKAWRDFAKTEKPALGKKIAKKIAHWSHQQPLGTPKATEKLEKWNEIRKVYEANPDEVKNYCTQKADKWQKKVSNIAVSATKSWVNIALNVAFIALLTLGLVLPFLAEGIALATGTVTVALLLALIANKLDVTYFFMDKFWNPADPASVPIPNV